MTKPSIINDLIEQYQSIQLAKSHLEKLNQRVKEEEQRLTYLSEVLHVELKEIEALEKSSIKNSFLALFKNIEDQLEIERQEYFHAILQYKEARKVLELLWFEKNIIEEKIKVEADIKVQLEQALMQRNLEIEQKYAKVRSDLNHNNKLMDDLVGYKREVHEALIVAAKAKKVILEMINYLEPLSRAESLSYSGIMGTDALHKFSKIDEALQLSYKLKLLFQELEDELEDIFRHKSLTRFSQYLSFQSFNEIYYERLISDWIVKRKLHATLSYLYGNGENLERIILTLERQLKLADISIANLLIEKEDLINKSLSL